MAKDRIIHALEELFRQVDKYRNCYFWGRCGNSERRERLSAENSIPEFEWDEDGHHYTAEFIADYRCSYVTARGNYTKDGQKTNLTAIKNSYKRMAVRNEKD